MKNYLAILICLLLTGAMAFAQPAPGDGGGPGGGGPGGGGGPRRGPGGGPGMMSGMPDMNGPQRGGPDGPGGPGGPMRQFDLLRAFLDAVDHYAKISSDPTTAGIAAVVSAADVLKPRGPEAAIDYFNKVLPEVKNESVARAIRAQLAQLYKDSGQQDKSLEQLHTLIVGAEKKSD